MLNWIALVLAALAVIIRVRSDHVLTTMQRQLGKRITTYDIPPVAEVDVTTAINVGPSLRAGNQISLPHHDFTV
jgi:hypothetical protein